MIIAIKKEDNISVGISICDCSADMTEKDLALADNLPFWKVKGEKDCYVCTDVLNYATDILRYNDYVFRGISDGKSVIENVLPKMKDLLSRHNQLIKNKEWQNQLLIIKSGKIFRINNYFCVTEVNDYTALASESMVLGVLDNLSNKDSKESVLTALRHVGRMRNTTFFPATIFDYKTKKKKIYYQ